MRLRIFEMGISYEGRTYEEGKKIRAKDGLRAIYCIFRYNAYRAPLPIQFLLYLLIGGFAAIVNFFVFLGMIFTGWDIIICAPIAFLIAAGVNYLLCILFLFRHKARWNSISEILLFLLVVTMVGVLDLGITKMLFDTGSSPALAKFVATMMGLVLNFSGRRFLVFPEPASGPWKPQEKK